MGSLGIMAFSGRRRSGFFSGDFGKAVQIEALGVVYKPRGEGRVIGVADRVLKWSTGNGHLG